jgi:hypothetical protein
MRISVTCGTVRLDQFWQRSISGNRDARGSAMATKAKVRRVYDNVEAALWATLLAFVIYFIVFTLPNMRKISEQNEIAQLQEIAAEKASYCEKFGMKAGTDKYNQCLLDLEEFRTNMSDRSEF